MLRRFDYFKECRECIRHFKVVAIATGIFAVYSIASSVAPLIDTIPPEIIVIVERIPKIPWQWALIAILCAVVFIAVEGGYRLRGEDRLQASNTLSATQAELAKERSTKNAPEIRLDLVKGHRGGFDLVVSNKSKDKNADAILVGRIETSKLVLDVERVDFLAACADVTPKARMSEKADRSQFVAPDYSRLFEDVCEEIGFEAKLAVAVSYRGLGHEFTRNVTIATNLIELEAVERGGMSGSPFRIEHGEIQAP